MSDFLPTTGRGPTRHFHPQTREVFRRVQTLYAAGSNTKQVIAVLRREFPATIVTVAIPESNERAHEHKDVATVQSALVTLMEQQTAVQTHLGQMQERFVQEFRETETRLGERDRQLTRTIRLIIEQKPDSRVNMGPTRDSLTAYCLP